MHELPWACMETLWNAPTVSAIKMESQECRILCCRTDGQQNTMYYGNVRNIVWMQKLVEELWLSRAWWPVPWICDAAFLCQAWQLPFWNLVAFAKPGKFGNDDPECHSENIRYTFGILCTPSFFRKWTGAHETWFLRMAASTVIVWASFKSAASILSILSIHASP